jgi:hypothetical protein
MDWVSCRVPISYPVPVFLSRGYRLWVLESDISFSQLMPSSEKKSIPELKTLPAVRPVIDSPLEFANGCIGGDTLGAYATMVSSASTPSLTPEFRYDIRV